jgi:hypothetical protein
VLLALLAVFHADRLLPPALASGRRRLAFVLLMFFAAAREFDAHKLFTGRSVLKVSWYLGPAPWLHKLIAAALVAVLAWALCRVARAAIAAWRQDWRRHASWAVTGATLVVVGVATKVLDRALNVLHEIAGVSASASERALRTSLEEGLELLLPVLVAFTLWQWRRGAGVPGEGRMRRAAGRIARGRRPRGS